VGLRAFLEIISQEPPALMRTCAWEKHIDGELLRVLREQKLLLSGPRAQWYENCPGASLACPARIIPTVGLRPKPYQAVPPEGHRCCRPKYLSEEEVATLEFNLPAFIAFVRDQLDITGTPRLDSSLLSDGVILSIGHKTEAGAERTVFYAPSLSNWAVVERLRTMRIAGPPSIVLVPARAGQVMPDLELEFSGHDRMKLRLLEDLFVWNGTGMEHRVDHAPAGDRVAGDAIAEALTDQGLVASDEASLRRLHADRSAYAFFLDAHRTVEGRCSAMRLPHHSADSRLVQFTQREAAVLLELVESKAPRRAAQLKALQDCRRAHPDKFVERVRRAVDATAGSRSGWTLFKTQVTMAGVKTYHFDPPPGLRYAVIRPVSQ